MGFFGEIFNDIKNAVAGDDVSGNAKKNKKQGIIASARDAAIEKSLLGVRKYYELKVDIVNDLSGRKPEWYFYDESSQYKLIDQLEADLKISRQKLRDNQHDINKLNSDKEDLNNKYKLISDRECKNREEYEDKCNDLQKLIGGIEDIDDNIKILKSKQEKIRNIIDDCLHNILVERSKIKSQIDKCRAMIDVYDINDNFAIIGLECIVKHYEGDFCGAYVEAVNYYQAEKENFNYEEQPIISYYVAKYLFAEKLYNVALKYIEYPIKMYPQNKDFHVLLRDIYEKMGNENKVDLENDILKLIS